VPSFSEIVTADVIQAAMACAVTLMCFNKNVVVVQAYMLFYERIDTGLTIDAASGAVLSPPHYRWRSDDAPLDDIAAGGDATTAATTSQSAASSSVEQTQRASVSHVYFDAARNEGLTIGAPGARRALMALDTRADNDDADDDDDAGSANDNHRLNGTAVSSSGTKRNYKLRRLK
jgi:hypothetical protein